MPGVGSGPSSAKSVWQPEVRSWDQEHSQVGSLLSVIMNQKIPSDSIEWYGSAPTSAPARDPEGGREEGSPETESESESRTRPRRFSEETYFSAKLLINQ